MARATSGLLATVLVLGLACSACHAQGPDQCASAANDKAVSVLMHRIQREHLYSSWTTLQCLDVEIEACTARRVDIVIREHHDQKCGGDPDTSPVVDRFRVSKPAGTIQWYDVVNDDYLPFAKVHTVGQR